MKKLSYAERIPFCKNSLAKQLLSLIVKKKSNLALSADVTESAELLKIADLLGPEICVLKTHIDILDDFSHDITKKLTALAKKHEFFIFEDRKFADIGNTVKHQYQGGIYKIADWADIINAHSVPGPGIVKGLMDVGLSKHRGLLMLAEMSSENNLADAVYAQKTLEIAEKFPEFVMGFISQHKLCDDPHWIYMTPGVQLQEGKDALGQQYVTPELAIKQHGSDIIIVGRGILQASDPLAEARKYREAAWNCVCPYSNQYRTGKK
jgi:uridine monophosphate synthetase